MKYTKNFWAYLVLIILTLTGAILASFPGSKVLIGIIVGLSVWKFLTVGFEFMELKHAHPFWRWMLGLYSALIFLIITLIL